MVIQMVKKDEEFGKYEIMRITNAYKRRKKLLKKEKLWNGEYTINNFLDELDNFVDQMD